MEQEKVNQLVNQAKNLQKELDQFIAISEELGVSNRDLQYGGKHLTSAVQYTIGEAMMREDAVTDPQ